MKNELKGFICGVILTTLVGCGVSAAGIWDNISVLRNDIKVVVNGNEVTADNFLYQDTTYLPLRAVSEALNQTVIYDDITNTAYIGEKNDDTLTKNKYTPSDVQTWAFVVEKDGSYYISPEYIRAIKGGTYAKENTNIVELTDNNSITELMVLGEKWKLVDIDGYYYIPYDTFVDEIEPLLK